MHVQDGDTGGVRSEELTTLGHESSADDVRAPVTRAGDLRVIGVPHEKGQPEADDLPVSRGSLAVVGRAACGRVRRRQRSESGRSKQPTLPHEPIAHARSAGAAGGVSSEASKARRMRSPRSVGSP